MAFQFKRHGRETLLTFPSFEGIGFLNHGYATRQGGASEGPYAGLNLGLFTEDDRERVRKNHERAADLLGIRIDRAVFSNQIHESRIAKVDEAFQGDSFWLGTRAEGCDALITNLPGRPLVTFFADCAGVFLVDPVKRAIGAAHAGWRGTVSNIGGKTLEAMGDAYGCRPEDCLAVVGPSIGPCCFEVGPEVARRFEERFGPSVLRGGEKQRVDLWEANRRGLLEAGLPEERIEIAGLCTVCRKDLFFSHRRDRGVTGRMACFMEIR